jgi:hypothetical protein
MMGLEKEKGKQQNRLTARAGTGDAGVAERTVTNV